MFSYFKEGLSKLASNAKYLAKHEGSFILGTKIPNALGITDKWTLIGKNLFLSKIPEKKEDLKIIEFVKLHGAPLGFILSCVEEKEINKDGLFMHPIPPREWADQGINQYQLKMEDFRATANVDEALRCIFTIQTQYRENASPKSVVIHCKAGKSRSAIMTVCLLALTDLYDKNLSSVALVKKAIEYVGELRWQIEISPELELLAIEIVEKGRQYLDKAPEENPYITPTKKITKTDIFECLANNLVKTEITFLESYKAIKKLSEDKEISSTLAESLKSLLDSIAEPNNGTWYDKLLCIQSFKYVTLFSRFKRDLETVMTLNLNCSKEEIFSIYQLPKPKSTMINIS